MEPQQQQQQTVNVNEENSSGSKGSYVCRQSSTRWTPTSEQIRILKELYYNCGVRSPNAEQIQRISARLRQYGKIEGKNVFYWFQNHKARERQKKRFTTSDHHLPSHPTTLPNPNSNCKSDHQYSFHNKYPDFTSGFSSATSSSAAGIAVGQMGNYGYGSINMEKSFRDCSISASNNNNGTVGRSMRPSYGWINCNSSYSFSEKQKSTNETLEHEEQEEDDQDQDDDEEEEVIKAGEIETLPLFPTQREDINGFCSIKRNPICYTYNWYGSTDDANTTSSRTSLELSLNSFTGQAPDSI